ncbi:MAG: extracellular solute-binding protein [Rhodospirillales bacterium]|nr:extracellular solute-binding protein [Rhodospirillales bacterium]
MKKSLLMSTIAAAGILAASTAFAGNLTVVSWGGGYTKSQVEAYHKPWEAMGGKEINSEDYNGGLAEVKAQVEAGKVVWDLVDVELSDAIRGCDEGLLEEIDKSILPAGDDGTPAKDDFLPGTLVDCGVASIVWTTIYAYDKTKFSGAKPATMADFFDTKKFPGKRGLRKGAKSNLEMAFLRRTFTKCWEPKKALLGRSLNWTQSKATPFGGKLARNRRKCWPMVKS